MLTNLKQVLINRSPHLYTSLTRARGRFSYRLEEKVLKTGHRTHSKSESAIYFTYYRCGSQFLKKALRQIQKENDSKSLWLDFESYMMHCEPRKGNIEQRIDEFLPRFYPTGHLYGPVYHAEKKLLRQQEMNSFCVLRDPRDVLVSHYYSLGFAHTVTNMAAFRRRQEVAAMTIDQFVLTPKYYSEIRERYQTYLDVFYRERDGVGFFRYEDMTQNFEGFLRRLLSHLKFEVNEGEIQKILKASDFETPKEDKISHRRSGRWGQFQKKLSVATVAELNNEFGALLEPWRDLN